MHISFIYSLQLNKITLKNFFGMRIYLLINARNVIPIIMSNCSVSEIRSYKEKRNTF